MNTGKDILSSCEDRIALIGDTPVSWGFFFSSRRRHTRWPRDWSSDVCSSDLERLRRLDAAREQPPHPPEQEVDDLVLAQRLELVAPPAALGDRVLLGC